MTNQSPTDRVVGRLLLEVCVGSLDDALAAQAAGANRLELCSSLELGGLTPSIGLVEQVCEAVELPVMAMIRPRAAGFCYSENEFRCMQADAQRVLEAGADGVVFGVLDAAGEIDHDWAAQLVAIAGAKETVFHRAFDNLANPRQALHQLAEQGVTRVLTSGGPLPAPRQTAELKQLIEHAAGRIAIMPGGGITPDDVPRLVSETGCQEMHIGASTGLADRSTTANQSAALCDLRRIAAGQYRAVDRGQVEEVRRAADQPR